LVRHGEVRRLAPAVRDGGRALKDNRAQLQVIVVDMAPGLTERRGVGPVTGACQDVCVSESVSGVDFLRC
jgi:transposase